MTAGPETDTRSSALMHSLQGGGDAALAELIELWQEPLLRFVFRYVQSEMEAREIVHEAFVRVHAQRAKFRGDQSFRSWVLTIAANLARNRRRWWRRHPSTAWLRRDADEAPPPETACPAPAPDHALLKDERVQAVRAAVEKLPHELKVALLLYEYEGLGYREIAAVIGCPERGVETRLAKARQRMRAELGEFLRAAPGPMVATTR
jgi:RNA polymerase sigma-70 factor (ECF subfamily)